VRASNCELARGIDGVPTNVQLKSAVREEPSLDKGENTLGAQCSRVWLPYILYCHGPSFPYSREFACFRTPYFVRQRFMRITFQDEPLQR